MTGICVLSDPHNGGKKLDKASASKVKDPADSPGNAAAGFAAILSGSMNQKVDPKGQNSKADQELEKKPSTKGIVQSAQDPNVPGEMLGYGNFVSPFLSQLMLQSDLPAGKEANSGNDVSQGTGILSSGSKSLADELAAGNNLSLIMKLLSLAADEVSAQSGMTTQQAQGDNPANSELDKYRQVIANLLEKLSGEITDLSPKNQVSSESAGNMDVRQNYANIIQGWITAMSEANNEADKDGQAFNGQTGIQGLLEILNSDVKAGSLELNGKVPNQLAALYQMLDHSIKDVKTAEGVNETKQPVEGEPAKVVKDTVLNPLQQGSTEKHLPESLILKNIQGNIQAVFKGESTKAVDTSTAEDGQNQSSGINLGAMTNTQAVNIADGKTTSLPVWAQVSSALHEQFINGSQDLKKLDIQLHPEDLGKIQIDLRWENGQVHLHVQASQAATGQLLQNHLSDLRQALENQGINCGLLQMGQGGEQQRNSHGNESQKTFKQNTDSAEDEDFLQVNNLLSPEDDGISRINVRA